LNGFLSPLQRFKAREAFPMTSSLPNRTKVFISYSHTDAKHLERLHKHLAPYERMGVLDYWDDTKIGPGVMWRKEIERAISCAKVAILLVSADFLASKFITENELPPLLAAAQGGGANILSVILSPSGFEDSGLAQFQAMNSPSRPLSKMNKNDKEDTWKRVAKIVSNAMYSLSAGDGNSVKSDTNVPIEKMDEGAFTIEVLQKIDNSGVQTPLSLPLMSKSVQETSVEEIARELISRRDQGLRPVLFLGSQIGGLYNNKFLYEILRQFSNVNFDFLSDPHKFRECYTILSKHFNEQERYNILIKALTALKYREEDKRLARLIKTGLFEAIISTNIDTFLEDAFNFLKLHESDDYRVFIPGGNDIMEILDNKLRYIPIIKVFGDLESRKHRIADERFAFQADNSFRKYLLSTMRKNVLMIGYDPVWDQTIEQVLPLNGGTFWYVNETYLSSEESLIAQIIQTRECKYLAGSLGSYSEFLMRLCGQDVIYKMMNMTEEF
jgi:TIR domain/SIR2-like domain